MIPILTEQQAGKIAVETVKDFMTSYNASGAWKREYIEKAKQEVMKIEIWIPIKQEIK